MWPGAVGGVAGCLGCVCVHIATLHPQPTKSLPYNVRLHCHRLYARLLGHYHAARFARQCGRVRDTQQELLLSIVRANTGTQYGQHHGFSGVTSTQVYRRLVPLMEQAQYESLVRRTEEGQVALLTAHPVAHLAAATYPGGGDGDGRGQEALWPVIKDPVAFKAHVTTTMLWLHVLFQKARVTLSPTLRLSYQPHCALEPDTALPRLPLLRYTNPVTTDYFVTPREAYLLTDEGTAYYVHAVFALSSERLEGLEYGTPQQCAMFWALVRSHWQQMCAQIHHGQISHHLDLPQHVRAALNACLPASPARASHLREQFERGWEGVSQRIWPHCTFVDVGESVGDSHQMAALLTCELRGVPRMSVVHTHGTATLGVHTNLAQGLSYVFLPHQNFYEFIPEDGWSEKQPHTLLLHQVCVASICTSHDPLPYT